MCQKSCGTYQCRAENADKCTVNVDPNCKGPSLKKPPVDSTGTVARLLPTIRKEFKVSSPGVRLLNRAITSQSSCRDSNGRCSEWSRQGECEKNPAWMKVNCKLSCGCTITLTARLGSALCKDYDQSCPDMASAGECTGKKIRYMGVMCPGIHAIFASHGDVFYLCIL